MRLGEAFNFPADSFLRNYVWIALPLLKQVEILPALLAVSAPKASAEAIRVTSTSV